MARPVRITDRSTVEIIVDDKYLDKTLQYGNWYRNANGYIVVDQETESGDITQVTLHRLVYELAYGALAPGQYVEHYDGDQNNNRLDNIRIVHTRAYYDNLMTRRGYQYVRHLQQWQAQVHFNGKTKILGFFNTELKAYEAVLKARTIYRLSFV
jgi:hypothetical protein